MSDKDKQLISERIEQVIGAAQEFCDKCENIGDTKNPDYLLVQPLLQDGRRYAQIALHQRKKALDLISNDISKSANLAVTYVDRHIDAFVRFLKLDKWYRETHESES